VNKGGGWPWEVARLIDPGGGTTAWGADTKPVGTGRLDVDVDSKRSVGGLTKACG
jgi:hypothetical protein